MGTSAAPTRNRPAATGAGRSAPTRSARRRALARAAVALAALPVCAAAWMGCAPAPRAASVQPDVASSEARGAPASAPATRPAFAGQRYRPPGDAPPDFTATKRQEPRDRLERWVDERGVDLRLMDRMLDRRTEPPGFARVPPPQRPPELRIARDVPLLDDARPFAEPPGLADKPVTIQVGVARSTYRTREPAEVLAAAQPFVDLAQREVNVRGAPALHESAEQVFFSLSDGRTQLMIGHAFEYLVVASWFAQSAEERTVLLGYGRPARVRLPIDESVPGTPGGALLLVVAAESPAQSFADLRGKRLALVANYVHGPGTFLTHLLRAADQPADQAYFGGVALRRFSKDAVIDLLKGKSDAACVDEGTLAMVEKFHGLRGKLRVIATSPRYNVDVIYTSTNNVRTHRTEIELTQRQLSTLGKNPEGQEVLFFFDTASWQYSRDGDIDAVRENFDDYLKFISQTPADLKALLDPAAPVDRQTYDVLGNE